MLICKRDDRPLGLGLKMKPEERKGLNATDTDKSLSSTSTPVKQRPEFEQERKITPTKKHSALALTSKELPLKKTPFGGKSPTHSSASTKDVINSFLNKNEGISFKKSSIDIQLTAVNSVLSANAQNVSHTKEQFSIPSKRDKPIDDEIPIKNPSPPQPHQFSPPTFQKMREPSQMAKTMGPSKDSSSSLSLKVPIESKKPEITEEAKINLKLNALMNETRKKMQKLTKDSYEEFDTLNT